MAARWRHLTQFNACDISDALLKLKVPGAGFLPDLRHFAPNGITSDRISLLPKIIAPATTVLFVPKGSTPRPDDPAFQGVLESNIPPDVHYVDQTAPETFVVMRQPEGQSCAVLGGIMAQRMKKCGAKGILVGGRVRDLSELKVMHIPIWAESTSTVGAGLEAKPWAMDVPINVQGVDINPGDLIFSDPVEGVVVIPQEKLHAVVELVPKLVHADDRVTKDVEAGMTVKDAFAKHRSNI
ncbi:MAG: hypothetical protein M1831_003663 [Alyxoria varia]|nr:MAG: hypothetical protein M1831_003663 [Alyxoria varia]